MPPPLPLISTQTVTTLHGGRRGRGRGSTWMRPNEANLYPSTPHIIIPWELISGWQPGDCLPWEYWVEVEKWNSSGECCVTFKGVKTITSGHGHMCNLVSQTTFEDLCGQASQFYVEWLCLWKLWKTLLSQHFTPHFISVFMTFHDFLRGLRAPPASVPGIISRTLSRLSYIMFYVRKCRAGRRYLEMVNAAIFFACVPVPPSH